MDKYSDGKMEKEDFIKTFHLAFPSRPEEKVVKLAEELANKDGKICKYFSSTMVFKCKLSLRIRVTLNNHDIKLFTARSELFHK